MKKNFLPGKTVNGFTEKNFWERYIFYYFIFNFIKEATDGPNPLRAKYKNLEKERVH